MPWRLIGFIGIFAILLAFTGFNLRNSCDISFGFKTIPNVPVFFTVFCSFIVGMLCAIPFVLGIKAKKRPKTGKGTAGSAIKQKKPEEKNGDGSGAGSEDANVSGGGDYGID